MKPDDTRGDLALGSGFLLEHDSACGHLCTCTFFLGDRLALLLGRFSLEVLRLLGGKIGEVGGDSLLRPEVGVELGLVVLEPRATFGRGGTKFTVLGGEGAYCTVDDLAWLGTGGDRWACFGVFNVGHYDAI